MSASDDEAEVEQTVQRIYAAIERTDATELDSYFDQDEILAFGRRWDSRHDSWSTISEEHADEFRLLDRIEISSAELRVSVSGDVAWAADRIHQRVTAGDGRIFESDARMTLVLRRRSPERRWKVVQFHASAGL